MGAKTVGSRSMKIAPVSSFRVEMRPLKRLEKKESGIQVSVWREVLNLESLPAPAGPTLPALTLGVALICG